MLDEIKCRRTVFGPWPQVSIEEDIDALVHPFAPDHVNAQLTADPALGTVGGDHVLGPHAGLAATHAIRKGRDDTAIILDTGANLGVEAQLARPLMLGEGPQHGLEVVLRAQAVAHWADGQALWPCAPGNAALDLLAGQRPRPDDKAGVLRPQAGLADGGLDAALAVHLHAARVDGTCLGVDSGARVALDQQRAHAVP